MTIQMNCRRTVSIERTYALNKVHHPNALLKTVIQNTGYKATRIIFYGSAGPLKLANAII